ncbi:MAG TPA: hypothetical protein VGI40_26120 [Pirellulaceae bacterium]|jgi:hypothetical protein
MFRFTIRDLLWLMVVVGLAVGWLADRQLSNARQWRSRAESLATICRNYGFTIVWDGDGVNGEYPPAKP